MAYQAGASLGQFWDAILELRSQRLKEQQTEAELADRMQARNMAAGQQIGSSIISAMGQRKQDSIANMMMNQGAGGMTAPPRAEAVGGISPEAADAAMQRFGGPTSPHTGGAEELAQRMQMQKIQQGNFALKQRQEQMEINRSKALFGATSKQFQDRFNNNRGYEADLATTLKGIDKAIETGNKDMYDQGVARANSSYEAATGVGLNKQPPVIPPFIKPEDKKAIEDAQAFINLEQQEQQGLQRERSQVPAPTPVGAPLSWLGLKEFGAGPLSAGPSLDRRLAEQGGSIEKLREEMMAMPGAKEYFNRTPSGRAAPGAGAISGNRTGQIVNGYRLGQKSVNPTTNETRIWNGIDWVPLK